MTTVRKVSGRDFTFAYFFVTAFVFFTYSMSSFYIVEGSFDMHYFKLGAIGSTSMMIGILCLNIAISTGCAAGPCIAIVSCQMIILSIASS